MKPLEAIDAPDWNVNEFAVSHKDEVIGKIDGSDSKSNCYLFISKGVGGTFLVSKVNADRLDSAQ